MSNPRSNPRGLLVAGVVLLAVLAGMLYLVATRERSAPDDTGGAAFSVQEREALGAAPVERGAEPSGSAPVDLNDPAAVASAYVVAGYSLRDTDAGRTNRRAVPYAQPGTPPSTIGVLVVTPPPAGHRSTVTVTDVEQVSGEETGTRRGFLVGYRTALDPPGRPDPDRHTRYLLLTRDADGHWLVALDSADGQVGES